MLLSDEVLKEIKNTVWFGEEGDDIGFGFVGFGVTTLVISPMTPSWTKTRFIASAERIPDCGYQCKDKEGPRGNAKSGV